jgi:hypothetical protein
MPTPMIVAFTESMPAQLQASARELCSTVADSAGEPVVLAPLQAELLDDLRAWLMLKTLGAGIEGVEPAYAPEVAPNSSSVPLLYRQDGKPDWGAMGGSFDKLALYGGPPQREPDRALDAPNPDGDLMVLNEKILEQRHGIFEMTGLYSEPAPPSWLAVSCRSRRMAAWMCAAIILENVAAKCEEEVLYVPASPHFEIEDEVRSVVTVVAKVNHYWQTHATRQGSANSPAAADIAGARS